LPTLQDTHKAHGSPPGDIELDGAKANLGWQIEPRFYIPDDVLHHFRESVQFGSDEEAKWQSSIDKYKTKYPQLGSELARRIAGELPSGWQDNLPLFQTDERGMATRKASGAVINALAKSIPELIGGSADLTPSNNTFFDGATAFQSDNHAGRYFHFGVREHAMGAIVNGMAYHGGVIPYGGTFLVFSDYMRPSVRLSALSHIPSIWVYTHDSIGVGEDGPTHQPVEHLAALRSIPNLFVIRPGDANEVTEAWKVAIQRRDGPTVLALSRQSMPTLDRNKFGAAAGLKNGAYVLTDIGRGPLQIILMASGSELSLILASGFELAQKGINSRIVSFPSWELFNQQADDYKNQVLPPEIENRLAVEAGVPQGWEKWVGSKGIIIGTEKYGASAPGKILMSNYGFTVENIVWKANELIGN
jgi:transketolase